MPGYSPIFDEITSPDSVRQILTTFSPYLLSISKGVYEKDRFIPDYTFICFSLQ